MQWQAYTILAPLSSPGSLLYYFYYYAWIIGRLVRSISAPRCLAVSISIAVIHSVCFNFLSKVRCNIKTWNRKCIEPLKIPACQWCMRRNVHIGTSLVFKMRQGFIWVRDGLIGVRERSQCARLIKSSVQQVLTNVGNGCLHPTPPFMMRPSNYGLQKTQTCTEPIKISWKSMPVLGFFTKLLHTCRRRRGRWLERSSGVSATSHLADPSALQFARSNTILRTISRFFMSFLTNFVLVQAEFSFHGNFPPIFFAGACRVRLDSLSCIVVSLEVCCARARADS